jgi:hypothetical protein
MQDQLIPSAEPGWVNVVYPRSSNTVLRVDWNTLPLKVTTSPLGTDGWLERFQVRADGNLQGRTDRPAGGGGGIILGLELKPL